MSDPGNAGAKRSALGTNSWHTAAVILQGSTISAELDGRLIGAVTDSQFTYGNAGVGTAGWSNAEFDNFSVTPLVNPTRRVPPRRDGMPPGRFDGSGSGPNH